jgi:two-component system nitrate/nitrite response regulator NarL
MIKVLIAGHTRIYRDGLSKALADCASLQVCGAFATAGETEAGLRALHPDILLIDILMDGALDVVRSAPSIDPQVKIVVLAVADRDTDIIACAEAGVSGFVTRDNSIDELIGAVIASAKGELACSPRQAATLLHHVARLSAGRTSSRPPSQSALTRRQAHVLELVRSGRSNKEIARILGIEVTTVKNHVHQVLGKLKVKRRGDAAAVADGHASAPHATPPERPSASR